MIFTDFYSMNLQDINIIIYALIILFRPLFFSLADVINAYIFREFYILPSFLMFTRGLFEILFISLYLLVLIFYFKIEFDFLIQYLIEKYIFKFINIIIMFLKALCLLEVINNFGAIFVSILVMAETVGGIINQSIDFYKSEKYTYELINIIIDSFSIFMLIIGALLYNEMIVLKNLSVKEEKEEGILIKTTILEEQSIDNKSYDSKKINSN